MLNSEFGSIKLESRPSKTPDFFSKPPSEELKKFSNLLFSLSPKVKHFYSANGSDKSSFSRSLVQSVQLNNKDASLGEISREISPGLIQGLKDENLEPNVNLMNSHITTSPSHNNTNSCILLIDNKREGADALQTVYSRLKLNLDKELEPSNDQSLNRMYQVVETPGQTGNKSLLLSLVLILIIIILYAFVKALS